MYSIIAVVYPNKFLDAEDIANNFLFNADRLVGSHISNGQSVIFFQVAPDAHIQLMWPRLGPFAPKKYTPAPLHSFPPIFIYRMDCF